MATIDLQLPSAINSTKEAVSFLRQLKKESKYCHIGYSSEESLHLSFSFSKQPPLFETIPSQREQKQIQILFDEAKSILFSSNYPLVELFPSKASKHLTFIDLFAGIGGFHIAMHRNGAKCVFACEWDKQARITYETNFKAISPELFSEGRFAWDINSVKMEDIPSFDILCAGFPCQPFSIAGQRKGFEDTRGTLFFNIAEIIDKKKPKAFLLENVKGLMNHQGGKTLNKIIDTLQNELGYYVHKPRLLNAKYYGVPQNRERVYIVGFREKSAYDSFIYPAPFDKEVSFLDVKEKNAVSAKYYLSAKYLETLRNHKKRHQEKGNGFGYAIINDAEIANTIVVGGMGRERNLVIDHRLTNYTPTTNIKGEINREGIRRMTPREWARLQGFPDEFLIQVSDTAAYKQFANSVAVPLVQAICEQVISVL